MGTTNTTPSGMKNNQTDELIAGDWFETDHKRVFYALKLGGDGV